MEEQYWELAIDVALKAIDDLRCKGNLSYCSERSQVGCECCKQTARDFFQRKHFIFVACMEDVDMPFDEILNQPNMKVLLTTTL